MAEARGALARRANHGSWGQWLQGRRGRTTAVASLAAHGIATIAINDVGHGGGSLGMASVRRPRGGRRGELRHTVAGQGDGHMGRRRLPMSNETLDGRFGHGRRAGLDRRVSERRDEFHALARYPLARTGVDRRRVQRRLAERRATLPRGIDADCGTTSNGLICPDCEAPLCDLFALPWISPRTDTIDGGYCSSCSRQFIRSRATGRYERWSCGRSH